MVDKFKGVIINTVKNLSLKKSLLWIVGILCLNFSGLNAQDLSRIASSNYPFIHYDVDDGLPQSIISGLMQDSYGYLWIPTNEGVAKFDGLHFKVYNKTTGFPFRLITGVVENKPGEIWIASLGTGLWRLKDNKFEQINFDPKLQHYGINFLVKTHDGEILLGAEPGGLYVFRNDSLFLHLSDQDGTLQGPIISAAKDNSGNYWIGSFRDGLQVFYGHEKKMQFTIKDGLPTNEIRSILPLNTYKVWVGTNKGLFVIGNPEFTDRWNKLFPETFVSSIYTRDNKNIWVTLSSKPGGVVHIVNNHIKEILQPNVGFFSKCVLSGNYGALFVGSYQGLFVYPDRNFQNYGKESGLTDTYIKAINEDCNGNLLVSTKNDGIFRLNKNHFERIGKVDSVFNGNSIFCIRHFNKKVWVGTARGLFILKNNQLVKNKLTKFFNGMTVRRIESLDDKIYIVTGRHIYQLMRDDSLKNISYNIKSNYFSLWGVKKDKNGHFVLATNGHGIWSLYDTTWVQLQVPDSIKRVFAVRADFAGNLYFATAKGAYKWDGQSFSTVLKLNQTVWDLLPTRENGIWLLTSRGLYQIKGNNIKIYNKKKGMITSEFNMGAIFYRNDNDFWFGGVQGLVHFKKRIHYPQVLPYLYITSISSKDTTLTYPFPKVMYFRAKDNSINIRFHQINFGVSPDLAFAYWLEGLNKDTVFVGNRDVNFVDYTNLNDGIYTFHLFLMNPVTHYIAEEKTVRFTILPPWWKSIWAIIIFVIAFAFLISLIVRWRVSILEKRNLILEKQVQERTHDIQLSYKLLKKETEERKKAELSLFKEREQLAITLKSIADGVIRTDLQGKIQLMNLAAEEITNYSLLEAINKNLNDLIELKNEETNELIRLPDYVKDLKTQEKHISYFNAVLKAKNSNEEKIINISWSQVNDEKQKETGYVWVFRDISVERKLENEMMRSQKLESIGLLAGGIAHDFNNILSGILGNAQLAQLALASGKNIDKYLKGIIEATQNATRLTQQLLTFAKGGEPVKEIISIKDLLSDSVEFALRGTNIACSYDINEELWAVEADKGQINQVINNLVINAIQAMPGGGKLTVKAENYDRNGSEKEIAELNGNHFVKISVSDTGHGIPKENIEKIFDPYFTTKQRGSGLGLATTYAIIKKHGGKILVESELGKGTTFHIYLPAIPDSKIKQKKEQQELTSWKGKRALVMDDEEYIRELMISFLEMLGMETETAREGGEAIQKYKKAMQEIHPFDVVIMDLTIRGGMGGKEAIKKILEIDAQANVIVASGYSTDSVLANAGEYGFKGRLSKPFSLEELNKVLNKVLKK